MRSEGSVVPSASGPDPTSASDATNGDAVPRPRRSAGRDLPIAIASGLLLAGVFLGTIFWHPLAFTVLIAVLVVLAAIETAAELRRIDVPTAVPALIVGGLTMVFGAYRSVHAGQVVGVLVLFLASIAWLLPDPQRRDVVRTLGTTMLLGLWLGFCASFGVLLINRAEDGPVAVLAVIGAAVLGDIGGYAVGVRLGRTKISPTISPNKTLEGLVGGLVLAAVLAMLVLPAVGDLFTVGDAAIIAVVCVLAGFAGDLTESMVKRDLGIKDLGRVLPGHGGILDRVDGILFALPVGFYAIALLT